MRDFGYEAQKAAEEHLAACDEAFWDQEEGSDPFRDSPASAPFDACDTCRVREALYAAYPILEAGIREDVIRELASSGGRQAEVEG